MTTKKVTHAAKKRMHQPQMKFYLAVFFVFFFLSMTLTGLYFLISDIWCSILRLL